MKKAIIIIGFVVMSCTSCSLYEKSNGRSSAQAIAKWKNVSVHGPVTIGEATQASEDANQGGGLSPADSLNGNKISGE